MIPDQIHNIWYGNEMPELVAACAVRNRNVFSRGCFFMNAVPIYGWAMEAFKLGQLANASNYMRLAILYELGGVYIDGDVQMLKPFNLDQECFIGFQRDDQLDDSLNTAVIGAVPKHPFIKRCMEIIEGLSPSAAAQVAACTVPTNIVKDSGIAQIADVSAVHVPRWRVTLYPKDYFHPFDWRTGFKPLSITERTHTIHYWTGLWK